jgi:hypothetical protein
MAVTQPHTNSTSVPFSTSGTRTSAVCCPLAVWCSRSRSVNRSAALTSVIRTSSRRFVRAARLTVAIVPV